MTVSTDTDTDTGARAAATYLASLRSAVGRRTMVSALNQIAHLAGATDWLSLNWSMLTPETAQVISSKLTGAPATINKALAGLRGVARQLFAAKLIGADDLQRIKDATTSVKGSRLPAGRDIDNGEVVALMRVCANDPTPAGARDAAIIALMRATGIRRAEVCDLMLDDLDIAQGRARVIGKGNKERFLPVLGGAANAMRDWLTVRGTEGAYVFCAINKVGRILVERGLTPQSINKLLDKRIEAAGIDAMTAHDFRRTLAGDLMDGGADIATVARLLGHSSVTTTQRYDRRGEEAVRKAAGYVNVPYYGRKQNDKTHTR